MPDGERYHVLKGGRRRGPFTAGELADYVAKGRFTPSDPCLRDGAMTTERLGDVLDLPGGHAKPRRGGAPAPADQPTDDPAHGHEEESPEISALPPHDKETTEATDAEDEATEPAPAKDGETVAEPEEEPEENEDSGEEEEDEDNDEADEAADSREPEAPPQPSFPAPSAILYAGRPSVLSYPRALLLMAAGIALAIWGHSVSGWLIFAGSLVAVSTAAWLSVTRSMRLYLIMPIRLEIIEGLVAKSSREVRITDIRSINIRKPGLRGLLGVGTVEFATAGGEEVDVAFRDVYGADRIKDLIRRLQDREE